MIQAPAWPLIDGPLKGKMLASNFDWFRAAEPIEPMVTMSQSAQPTRDDLGIVEYRLYAEQRGGFFWSCNSENAK